MPPQSPEETRKLVAFVAIVASLVSAILAANVAVRDKTSAFAEGAGTPRRAGLERLAANPTRCAMTLEAAPDNERPMRHVNAGIIGKVGVLELGQSDADHMTRSFFKDDARFYNGFVSNSYFVYHYEVYEDIKAAHGAPELVLYDIRPGQILREGREPEWDTPKEDAVWWGFPPFHLGKAAPLPWYRDIPSLLSLAQTGLTLTWLDHQLPHAQRPPDSGATDADNGAQFRCVALDRPSGMYRWMADGSRIYKGEVGGVLPPPGQVHVSEAVGERHVNPSRMAGIDWVLGRIKAEGSAIITYSPPLHPVVFEDPKQVAAMKESHAALTQLAEKYGLDYCDLSMEARSLGCTARDFSDEHHISRHCNQMIVKRLVNGCAPRAGELLRSKLADETLK